MEDNKRMTTEQAEARLKSMRIKVTVSRVLTWGAVAAMLLSLIITQNLLIALGFLVIALVFGIPAGRAIRKRDKNYKLLVESVIDEVVRDVLGDGVEYNPVGAFTPGSVAVPFHYTHSSGDRHIKTVCNGVNIELGSVILYDEYGAVADEAYGGIEHRALFRGPWLICDFGKKPACDVYVSQRSKRCRHQLRTMGCRRLDCLILTHYDADHISGAVKLLEHISVSTLVVPELPESGSLGAAVLEAAEACGTSVQILTEPETIDLGSASLTVYPPLSAGEDNERGLTILASAGERDLLITGDMDSTTERALLAAYDLPDIEVLVVGHHGSKYSTSDDLLDALSPETAVISVGSNSYGHPTDETLRRLAAHGCAIYRTDLQGGIHLSLN